MSILFLPLIAAFLHAIWNALLKTSGDRLAMLGAVTLTTAITGAAALPFVEPPSAGVWPVIVASGLLKFSYYAFIFYAYRIGDLSLIYPLARGFAPLAVTLGAALFAGEVLPWQSQVGVIVVCVGITSLSVGHLRALRDPIPLLLGLGAGINIAAYTLCDGIGARMSGSPFGYIAWAFLAELPVALFALFRRRRTLTALGQIWRQALAVGVLSVSGYVMVMYAIVYAPMALVSALRETSVIFAAIIGTLIMGERPWQERIVASAAVAGGVALMVAFRA